MHYYIKHFQLASDGKHHTYTKRIIHLACKCHTKTTIFDFLTVNSTFVWRRMKALQSNAIASGDAPLGPGTSVWLVGRQ